MLVMQFWRESSFIRPLSIQHMEQTHPRHKWHRVLENKQFLNWNNGNFFPFSVQNCAISDELATCGFLICSSFSRTSFQFVTCASHSGKGCQVISFFLNVSILKRLLSPAEVGLQKHDLRFQCSTHGQNYSNR